MMITKKMITKKMHPLVGNNSFQISDRHRRRISTHFPPSRRISTRLPPSRLLIFGLLFCHSFFLANSFIFTSAWWTKSEDLPEDVPSSSSSSSSTNLNAVASTTASLSMAGIFATTETDSKPHQDTSIAAPTITAVRPTAALTAAPTAAPTMTSAAPTMTTAAPTARTVSSALNRWKFKYNGGGWRITGRGGGGGGGSRGGSWGKNSSANKIADATGGWRNNNSHENTTNTSNKLNNESKNESKVIDAPDRWHRRNQPGNNWTTTKQKTKEPSTTVTTLTTHGATTDIDENR